MKTLYTALFICLVLFSPLAKAQLYNRETNNTIRYTDSTAQVAIFSLYNLLQNGEDFSELAFRYSQDSGSYKQGGELNLTTMNDYVSEYREAVLVLSLNELSKPFKTDFGYHIVQLLAKQDGMYRTRHILLRTN